MSPQSERASRGICTEEASSPSGKICKMDFGGYRSPMLIREWPEKLVIQEEPGWSSGLGGTLVVVGVMVLAATVGVFSGMKWSESWLKEFSFWASLAAISIGLFLVLSNRGWLLELDRMEQKVTLRRASPISFAKAEFTFGEVEGVRILPVSGRKAQAMLEVLTSVEFPQRVIYRFVGDEASCARAKEKIERVLKEPRPETPYWDVKARMRM